MMKTLIAAAALAACAGAAVAADELVIATDARTRLGVTVYNNGLALVKDRRTVPLQAGLNAIAFEGISPQAVAESALLTGEDVRPFEQNLEFDMLTPEALLRRSVGREVTLIRTHPVSGQEMPVTATVLSAEGGTVLRVKDRIETGVPGRLVFDKVPERLRAQPTLVAKVETGAPGERDLELDYLTDSLDWRADYSAQLRESGKLDLRAWATLINLSGTRYPDAQVKLVAGEVRRRSEGGGHAKAMAMIIPEADREPAAREQLAAFHIYTLNRPVTLEDQQSKQVALFSAGAVLARAEYLSSGGPHPMQQARGEEDVTHPEFRLTLKNDKASNLGLPLPAGAIRIYKRDGTGDLQFMGEDVVADTPEGGTVALALGRSFDVSVKRTQIDFTVKDLPKDTAESAWRIELDNARTEPVTVKVVETFAGSWDMVQQSRPHVKESADRAAWSIDVPPQGSAKLEYRVRLRR